MPDYSKGKIYKIVADGTDQVYIGSTCGRINDRFYKHKSDYELIGGKCSSSIILAFPNPRIELIENYPCESKVELLAREMTLISENVNSVNQVRRCNITPEQKKEHSRQYNLANKEKKRAQAKIYSDAHKAEACARSKAYYQKRKLANIVPVVEEPIIIEPIEPKNVFSNGKIYKIVADETDQIYIGSTTSPLNERFAGHKTRMGDGTSSAIILAFPSARIELLEEYPCDSKPELLLREQYHINEKECVNTRKILVTTREEKLEYKRNYHAANRENANARRNASYHQNKEVTLAKLKLDYQTKGGVRVVCECGQTLAQRSLQSHKKTKNHSVALALLTKI